jgi:hypothetical protein
VRKLKNLLLQILFKKITVDPEYELIGSEPGFIRPVVVIQNNIFNQSRISTVVVCALTSNPKYANFEGNVPLDKGEANLQKPSVVNVSPNIHLGSCPIGGAAWDIITTASGANLAGCFISFGTA